MFLPIIAGVFELIYFPNLFIKIKNMLILKDFFSYYYDPYFLKLLERVFKVDIVLFKTMKIFHSL